MSCVVGCAQTGAFPTGRPSSFVIVPLILASASKRTTASDAPATSRCTTARERMRTPSGGSPRTTYVPWRSRKPTSPFASVTAQRSPAPEGEAAQIRARATGPFGPSARTLRADSAGGRKRSGSVMVGASHATAASTIARERSACRIGLANHATGSGGVSRALPRAGAAQQTRHLGERTRDLLALLPAHEVAHRRAYGLSLEEDRVRLHGDRHLDAEAPRGGVRRFGRADALRYLAVQLLPDLREREALREKLTDPTVARVLAGARRDEVSEAREARRRERVAAMGEREARDLGEAPRDEAGLRVVAVADPVDRAGAERHDVLQRAAELDADDVVVRIRPEEARADERLEVTRGLGVVGGDDRRRGLPIRDLAADVRSGEHRDARRRECLGPQLAHPLSRVGIETLRRGEHAVLRADQGGHAVAESAHALGRHRDDEVVRLERTGEVGGDVDAVGYPDPRQVAAVLATRGELFRLRRVARPEDDLLPAVTREDGREGRPPRAGLEHGDAAGHALPIRGSAPRIRRPMFARWR